MATDKQALAPWMRIAESYVGQKEIAGSRHNAVIVGFYAKAGHPEIQNDEVAWCAAFVNAVLYEANMRGTNSLMARSFLKWSGGDKVATPRYGDIVVFKRGTNPASGHVAFFERWDDEYVYVIGGNQSDAVTRARYRRSALLGFMRPRANAEPAMMPQMTDQPPKTVTAEEIVVGVGGTVTAINPLLNEDFLTGVIVIIAVLGIVSYLIWKRLRA